MLLPLELVPILPAPTNPFHLRACPRRQKGPNPLFSPDSPVSLSAFVPCFATQGTDFLQTPNTITTSPDSLREDPTPVTLP